MVEMDLSTEGNAELQEKHSSELGMTPPPPTPPVVLS